MGMIHGRKRKGLVTRNGEGMVLEKFTRTLTKELSLNTKEGTGVHSLCNRRNRGKMDGDAASSRLVGEL